MSPERCEYDDYVLSLAADDEMGRAVSFEGNLGVFGAHRDDEGGDFAGAVFLFDLQTGEQTGKLIASDPGTFDGFGQNVGISNNTIIVASPLNDIDGERVGSAYLFNATTGVEITKLTSPTPHADDRFGFDVGVHGSTAIVTAAAESTVGDGFGAAYLFDVATPGQMTRITASDAASARSFGWSVAMDDTRALVGAPNTDGGGAAYVFDTSTSQELLKLTASDRETGDSFGISVALSGNVAIVGAYNDDGGGSENGAAYLFDLKTGTQLHKLTASDRNSQDDFGASVGILGNIAIVGAPHDDSTSSSTGSAYLFDVATGIQLGKLTSSDQFTSGWFGYSVALKDNVALIGAPRDWEGDVDAGAVFMFEVPVGSYTVGDTNFDGTVNALDLATLADNWLGETPGGASQGDFNGDAIVNALDLSILANNWLATAAGGEVGFDDAAAAVGLAGVPEPSSVVLLGGACALNLARRRPGRRRLRDADFRR